MAAHGGDVEGVHVGLGSNLNDTDIAKPQQVAEYLLHVVVGGHVQGGLAGVVLHGHQIGHRGPIWKRRLLPFQVHLFPLRRGFPAEEPLDGG